MRLPPQGEEVVAGSPARAQRVLGLAWLALAAAKIAAATAADDSSGGPVLSSLAAGIEATVGLGLLLVWRPWVPWSSAAWAVSLLGYAAIVGEGARHCGCLGPRAAPLGARLIVIGLLLALSGYVSLRYALRIGSRPATATRRRTVSIAVGLGLLVALLHFVLTGLSGFPPTPIIPPSTAEIQALGTALPPGEGGPAGRPPRARAAASEDGDRGEWSDTSTTVFSGRVVLAKTQEPVPRAVVAGAPLGSGGPVVRQTCDDDGRFTFDSPADWQALRVIARKQGLVPARATLIPGRSATLALEPGAAYSGRVVTCEDPENPDNLTPLPGVRLVFRGLDPRSGRVPRSGVLPEESALGPDMYTNWAETRSDPQGEFRVTGLSGRIFYRSATKDGFAEAPRGSRPIGGCVSVEDSPEEILLAPAFTFAMEVRDATSDAPVRDFSLRNLLVAGDVPIAYSVLDRSPEVESAWPRGPFYHPPFRIWTRSAESVEARCRVVSLGFEPEQIQVSLAPYRGNPAPVPLVVRLAPLQGALATLRIRIASQADRIPVPVEISTHDSVTTPGTMHVNCVAGEDRVLTLPAGTYRVLVWATADQRDPIAETVQLAPGPERFWVFAPPGGRIEASVFDPGGSLLGRPLTLGLGDQASSEWRAVDYHRILLGEDGRFRMRVGPGRWTLWVAKEGYRPASTVLEVTEGATARVSVILEEDR